MLSISCFILSAGPSVVFLPICSGQLVTSLETLWQCPWKKGTHLAQTKTTHSPIAHNAVLSLSFPWALQKFPVWLQSVCLARPPVVRYELGTYPRAINSCSIQGDDGN